MTGNARANAWFVGMAPRRNPDIVVAVLCEHGGWGATAAAPVAAQVINAFVTKQRRREGNLIQVSTPKPAAVPAISQPSGSPQPSGPPQPPSTPKPPSSPADISMVEPGPRGTGAESNQP